MSPDKISFSTSLPQISCQIYTEFNISGQKTHRYTSLLVQIEQL